MGWFLAFWNRRSTPPVVAAARSASARTRANARRSNGYGSLLREQKPNEQVLLRLIRKGTWVWVHRAST
jgi:hypothetical protein